LFYAVIVYLVKSKSKEIDSNEDFQDYFRICRNYTFNIRQNNKHKYNSDLREKNIGNIVLFFEEICTSGDVYYSLSANSTKFPYKQDLIKHEIDKAKLIAGSSDSNFKNTVQQLEDNVLLIGNLRNLMPLLKSHDFSENALLFEKVWLLRDTNNSLLCRGFLSCGDYFEDIGNSNLGKQIYFGSKERWNRILTSDTEGKPELIYDFIIQIKQFQGEEITDRLNQLIDFNLSNNKFEDWKSLFIKYSCILSSDWNIFSFRRDNWNDYRVERFTGTTLSAWHNNTYIHAVIQNINKDVVEGSSYKRNSEIGSLNLKNGISLFLKVDYWQIDNYNMLEEADSKPNFNFHKNEIGKFELKPDKGEDIVEVAIRFIKTLFENE
jgi:hypothetical protein